MGSVADHAAPISDAAEYAKLLPGLGGLEYDRDEFKENLEAASRKATVWLDGLADKLEKTSDPRDLGQGPLIRGGSPGMNVECESDSEANPRPPEDT
jgi:hypothetical protein